VLCRRIALVVVLIVASLLLPGCGLLQVVLLGAPEARPPAAGPAPAGGDGVRMWQDAGIFTAATELIGGATDSVLVEMYEFGRRDLASALMAAHRRGAKVRVIFDATVPASARTARSLTAAGVDALAYPVDDRRGQIDHVKLLVADSTALAGGMNWGVQSHRNHDYVLELSRASTVNRLKSVFEQDWALASGRPPVPPPPDEDAAVFQTSPGSEIRAEIGSRLAGARTTAMAELFVLSDPDLVGALVSAHRRGVRVRVLVDPNQTANAQAVRMLHAAGVHVRGYRVKAGAKLHAKAALIDSVLIVGSANWSVSGLGVNHELDVETAEPNAARGYAARFELDWAASA
jgi:phosphatidylserine/phosphatidylglycerophosphate/cardiolipin synthase-like enzyme